MLEYLRSWISRFAGAAPSERIDSWIEEILDATRKKVQSADADTPRQWARLNAVLAGQGASRTSTVRRRVPLLRPAFGLALAAAGCLLVWFLLTPGAQKDLAYNTGRGEQSAITLVDSTEVTLNHTSALLVIGRKPGEPRRVTLVGEGFFHVRKDGTPFIVSTSMGSVEVLGTSFNVRVRNDMLEVGVVTGRVRVIADSGAASHMTILDAGNMVSYRKGGGTLVPEPLQFADFPGWMHHQLQFQHTPLSEVCREIEERFDVAIRIENTPLAGLTVTGALDTRTPEAALTTLAQLTGARVKHESDRYLLY